MSWYQESKHVRFGLTDLGERTTTVHHIPCSRSLFACSRRCKVGDPFAREYPSGSAAIGSARMHRGSICTRCSHRSSRSTLHRRLGWHPPTQFDHAPFVSAGLSIGTILRHQKMYQICLATDLNLSDVFDSVCNEHTISDGQNLHCSEIVFCEPEQCSTCRRSRQ